MFGLNQKDFHDTSKVNKGLFVFLILIFTSLTIIGIITIVTAFTSYDPSQPETEKVLQDLNVRHKKGEKLSEKEFELYCLLLKKIWKIKLSECICKDGMDNLTPGIDWLNPPKSSDELNDDWIEVTPNSMKERSSRKVYRHKKTLEEIAFEIGRTVNGERTPSHWHRYNPNSTDNKDLYLDICGKVVGKSLERSHIYIEEFAK